MVRVVSGEDVFHVFAVAEIAESGFLRYEAAMIQLRVASDVLMQYE